MQLLQITRIAMEQHQGRHILLVTYAPLAYEFKGAEYERACQELILKTHFVDGECWSNEESIMYLGPIRCGTWTGTILTLELDCPWLH